MTPTPSTPASDVRASKPRAAPLQPVLPELITAWHNNPRGLAWALLAVNLVLLTCTALLFSRLTTGDYLDLSGLWAQGRRPLGECFMFPISLYQSPMHGLVLAGLLAVLTAGPIIVGQFYGTIWGWMCLPAVAVLAHLPVLAAVLAGAVWLATTPLVQMRNRFASGSVAMVLPAGAMWLSTATAASGAQAPMERVFLHFPWLIAAATAGLMLLGFWLLARLLNYRAGIAAAALAVPLLAAGLLFVLAVGSDELEFRLLDARFGVQGKLLADGPIRGGPVNLSAVQTRCRDECEAFLDEFPDSEYRAYVLFLLARGLDLRLDESAAAAGRREFYDDMVSDAGAEVWRRLADEHPDDPLSLVAHVRIGQYYLGRGDIATGLAWLRPISQRWAATSQPQFAGETPPAPMAPFKLRPRQPVTLHLVAERIRPAEQWLTLIDRNRPGGPGADAALVKYFALDPRRPTERAKRAEIESTLLHP